MPGLKLEKDKKTFNEIPWEIYLLSWCKALQDVIKSSKTTYIIYELIISTLSLLLI